MQAFVPALQREDGSYIGTDTTSEIFGWSNLIAVSSAGSVLWKQAVTSTPTYITPQYATADGGMIVQSKQVQNCQSNPPQCDTVGAPIIYSLDMTGTATAQSPDLGVVPAWSNRSYIASPASMSAVTLPAMQWATGYTSMTGGNLSENGSAIGVFEAVEGLPVYGLSIWGTSCKLGSDKVPLTDTALSQYNDLKDRLLTAGFVTSQHCQAYFSADPTRAPYFSKLTGGIKAQVPYDGRKTRTYLINGWR